jgi:hypothetical protein
VAAGRQPADSLHRRLLATIDCTKDHLPERYFAYGETRVVATAAGRYREAQAKHAARFGYRFAIEHVGRPHLALIRYPDDKRRYMCIMDGTSYDLSTGVFTGFAQPLSGRMLEIHQVFWPRWNDCSITFMTWGEGEPAAVASVEVYELAGLPALEVPGDPGDGSRRELGIQYEDPCGTGASEGAMNREEWLERVIAYARHTGQKLFVYPLAWYHGPQVPCQREPSDGLDTVVARDRKQYVRWTTHPQDWYAHLLARFGEEGLGYQASLTLLRLGSLMQKMNIDLASIRAGAETINNMLWNDQVQSSTQDWTPLYNVRNFPKALEFYEQGLDWKDFPWAHGERGNPLNHGGPIFNPLHPVVQEAVLGLVGEIATRYARYRAFKGLSFNMWHATLLWYGSLHSGYDDHTVSLFEKETAITVPIDRKAPDRFSRRYDFLIFKCRPAWIAWRCHKVQQLCRRIRDTVVAARPDLRVTFTLWTETMIPQLLGPIGVAQQLHARASTVEMVREAGLDLDLFRDEPGIELDLHLEPQRDRGGWGALGASTPLEQATMFRDHDFLDQTTLEAMHSLRRPGAFIFNSWVEAWGKHKWFACEPRDAQCRELAVMDGKPAEGIFRINSEYPPDGFWWDSQLRITHAFQPGLHFLEHYAHAVAEFDSCRITRGGLFLDKAHSEEIQRFARAYRALPQEKFETVGATTDPVALRTLVRDGKRYFYLVNRDYYETKVELVLDPPPEIVTDLATQEDLRVSGSWELVLGPYELRSLAVSPNVRVTGFQAKPPEPIATALVSDGRKALRDIEDLRAKGMFIPGMDELQRGIESALAEGRLAWLRRALAGYIVRKCRAELARE